jgi:anaerobic selenocysteine-containing dehydrogenase
LAKNAGGGAIPEGTALAVSEKTAICRLCPAQCGIKVKVSGAQVVDVRGDPDHPVSKGYTCSKGRAMASFHHDPRRLDHPLRFGTTVDWETCLDDLADRLRGLLDRHGPDSIGFYSGMGEAYDRAGMMAKVRFFSLLGTRQRYTAATVDVAPLWRAAELVTGYALELTPFWEPEHSPGLVLMIGSNPVISHGYANCSLADPIKRIRDFRQRGGELWVLDPRRTETAALADRHLTPRPGTDVLVLAWLVRELLAEGADTEELEYHCRPSDIELLRAALVGFTLDVVAARTGLEAASLEELLARIRRAGPIACISGTGVTFGRNALVTEWLRWALHIVTGSLDRPGGLRFLTGYLAPFHERATWSPAPAEGRRAAGPQTRPELSTWFGEYPVVALPDEIEAGNLRALFVFGANPLTALPDPQRTTRALTSLEVFGVFDVVGHALTDLATHVLPVADMLERPDISGREGNFYTPAVVPLAADRRPQWWVIAQIGKRLGLDVLGGLDPDECTAEDVLATASGTTPERLSALMAAGPHGVRVERSFGWVRERALPDGCWRLAPEQLVARLPALLAETATSELTLVSRRQARNVNCVRYTRPADEHRDPPDVHVHPDDAARAGLLDGSAIRVRSESGAVSAVVTVDSGISPGSVSMTHGFVTTNVNRLTSPVELVDPLTGQPVISGIPVELEPIREAAAVG